MRIVFYVSGHGLGHATRAIVSVEELVRRGHYVTVVAANGQLFSPLVAKYAGQVQLRIDHDVIDPGVAQKDAVSVDIDKSILQMFEFLKTHKQRVESEIEWLKNREVDVILLDAPPIPAAAAKELGVPSVLISNFGFDSIFEGLESLGSHYPKEATFVSSTLRQLYSKIDFLLRLPGAIPNPLFDYEANRFEFGSFERGILDAAHTQDLISNEVLKPVWRDDVSKILQEYATAAYPRPNDQTRKLNLPLVVRLAITPRDQFRAFLGIPIDALVVLITFGGHSATTTSPARSRNPSPNRSTTPNPFSVGPNTEIVSISTTLSNLEGSNVAINESENSMDSWKRDEPIHAVDRIVPPGWHTIIAVPGPKGDLLNDYIDISAPEMISIAPADAFVPDLLQASDVVVGKCGYGTCAEVVAHGVPLVYVPRPAFVEEVGLINNIMKPFGMGVEMSQKDFYAGNWANSILQAHSLKMKGPVLSVKMNGERVAVDCVESIARNGRLPGE
ncbi:hypothetical protein BDR26DRAFT_1013063 [Obelidium mucronatum]|nr:hypothetical protein BDR26DRAFT_1013063 [Obelidium mucronatum]